MHPAPKPLRALPRRRAAGRAPHVVLALLAWGLTACGSSAPPPAAEAPAETRTPVRVEAQSDPPAMLAVGPLVDELPAEVRAAVHPRMVRHGKDLTDLYGAMQAGQRSEVQRIAEAIADEPDLAAAGGEDTVNATIPPVFFERQSALHASARALAAAAAKPDEPIAPAFDALAASCAGCHAPR